MARIRTVKPEFWLNEELAALSPDTRLLAIGVLNHSDDEGYFRATPQILKAAIFPYSDDSTNIPRMLQDLSCAGYLRLGTGTDGKRYGHVINFLKHQRVDKPKPSEIKGMLQFDEDSKTTPRTIQELSKEERKGKEVEKEGMGKGNNAAGAAACDRFFADFWDLWPKGFGDKGSRKNAEAVFRKLNPTPELYSRLCLAVDAQYRDKSQRALSGQFCPNFKHVERWLKNREWENEIQPQRPVKQSRADHIESVLDQAFGEPGPSAGILEGDFQRIDPHEPAG